jgi:hypothetical protein
MSDSVHIHLNRAAVDALMRDEGVKVKLSQQVIEHIVGKHVIKAVENGQEIKAVVSAAQEAVLRSIKEQLKNTLGVEFTNHDKRIIRARLPKDIETGIREAVTAYVRNTLEAEIKRCLTDERLNEVIQSRATEFIKTSLTHEIQLALTATLRDTLTRVLSNPAALNENKG